jgi:hypothetical protein
MFSRLSHLFFEARMPARSTSPYRQKDSRKQTRFALALLDTGFLWLREVACLLVRLNHLARFIVNADHGIM